jgi:hypothetical protein
MLALTMLSGMVLVLMLAALNMPRSARSESHQRAASLARSAVERMRSLPLDSAEWAPAQTVDATDPELDVVVRVSQPQAGFRLLEVRVRRRTEEANLVRLSLLRTEGGP